MGASRRRLGFFLLPFGSGFAVLTIEIAGARLIAPVFGLSVVPWTAVIGVILAALAAGSHLGGRLADAGRVPLSRILFAAGLTGALPVLGAGFPWAARAAFGFIPGAVASALVLFAPPVLCLGAVVPYLVQADTESLGSVGRRAGDLSAAADWQGMIYDLERRGTGAKATFTTVSGRILLIENVGRERIGGAP